MSALLECVNSDDYLGCQAVIESGVDVNEDVGHGNTVLYYATHDSKILELLLTYGGNPNVQNINGITPLHCAVDSNCLESIRVLMRFNADIESKDNGGWSPLYTAVMRGKSETVELLLMYGANPYSADKDGKNVIQVAKDNYKFKSTQILKKYIHIPLVKRALPSVNTILI